jgi:hypothetical protein
MRLPGFLPTSMLDFGSGPGTAIWAAHKVSYLTLAGLISSLIQRGSSRVRNCMAPCICIIAFAERSLRKALALPIWQELSTLGSDKSLRRPGASSCRCGMDIPVMSWLWNPHLACPHWACRSRPARHRAPRALMNWPMAPKIQPSHSSKPPSDGCTASLVHQLGRERQKATAGTAGVSSLIAQTLQAAVWSEPIKAAGAA